MDKLTRRFVEAGLRSEVRLRKLLTPNFVSIAEVEDAYGKQTWVFFGGRDTGTRFSPVAGREVGTPIIYSIPKTNPTLDEYMEVLLKLEQELRTIPK